MIRLATLADGAARSVLPADRDAVAWHQALAGEIAARLSPAHAALLAAPRREGDGLAWYVPDAAIRRYADFAPPERLALVRTAGAILSDIRRLAESGAAPAVAACWPGLREVPRLDYLFAVDGRPVLAGWGHAPPAGGGGLLAAADDAVAWRRPPRLAQRVYAVTAAALAGLLLAGVVLAWLLLPGFAPPLVCRAAPGQTDLLAQAQREADRAADLRRQIAAIDQDTARRQLDCPVPRAIDPPAPAPAPAAPPPLPADRWQHHDLALLQGCWNRYTNMQLRAIETGQISSIRSWTMCFDQNGHGHQTITLDDGEKCAQSLQAQFDQAGLLRIAEAGRCRFPNRSVFNGRMTCTRESDTEASCPRTELEGPEPGHTIPGQFRRQPGAP